MRKSWHEKSEREMTWQEWNELQVVLNEARRKIDESLVDESHIIRGSASVVDETSDPLPQKDLGGFILDFTPPD